MNLQEFLFFMYGFIKSKPIGNVFAVRRLLRRTKRFKYVEVLGQGSFGLVVGVDDEAAFSTVAIKAVDVRTATDGEREYWATLSNPHLAHLKESFVDGKFIFFVMSPAAPTTLDLMVCDRRIRLWDSTLSIRRKWLSQILKGLIYLHSHELCHLDLVAENILISATSDAIIADFGTMRKCTLPVPSSALKKMKLCYRPPETFLLTVVEGMACDLWNFGLLIIESLTHFVIDKSSPRAPSRKCDISKSCRKGGGRREDQFWKRSMYPFFCNILNERIFTSLVRMDCVNCSLSVNQFRHCLHFISLFLTPEPNERVHADDAAHHTFLHEFIDVSFSIGSEEIRNAEGPNELRLNECSYRRLRFRANKTGKRYEIFEEV